MTWQDKSHIIEPGGTMVGINQNGVMEIENIPVNRDQNYYSGLFK